MLCFKKYTLNYFIDKNWNWLTEYPFIFNSISLEKQLKAIYKRNL